jgi:hypothetical protein
MARLAKERFLVLMADNAPNDCLLLRVAISKNERMSFIGNASDGRELMFYMKGEGKYADRERYPLPDKMLLDLVIPRKEGSEIVEWLRGQPFEDMVVVVFSGTAAENVQEVEKTFPLSTDLVPPRPNAFRRQNLVKLLEDYLSHK